MMTMEDIESLVQAEQYHVFPGTTMTVCCLTLKSGFAVIGYSACIYPEDFNEDLGREFSREHAIDKLFELEGYRLKSVS